jgi:hypothetical protein
MLEEIDAAGQVGVCDPTGAWLQDHADHLDGLITHDELKRRNCERYRNSVPICASTALSDSEVNRRRAMTLPEQTGLAAAEERRERRYRRVRRNAITWSIIAALGVIVLLLMAATHQWLMAVVLAQPLVGSIFDALKSLYDWRHFDE